MPSICSLFLLLGCSTGLYDCICPLLPRFRALVAQTSKHATGRKRFSASSTQSVGRQVLGKNFFWTLSGTKSSFITSESVDSAEEVQTSNTYSALLAGMLPPSEGVGGTPSSVFPTPDSPEKASEPIGSLGSLAEYQLATPSFRRIGRQD